ncbi:MAG: hypothetical protein U5J98_00790 [Halobacteriales archaeon]|nr:hypothetical protein [Halobacteriales archaeon]
MTVHPDAPEWVRALLVISRVGVLAVALAVTAISYRAYRRTGTEYLRTASVGFAVIAVGVFIEGVLFELLELNLAVVHIVESVAVGIGFLILLRSLRG